MHHDARACPPCLLYAGALSGARLVRAPQGLARAAAPAAGHEPADDHRRRGRHGHRRVVRGGDGGVPVRAVAAAGIVERRPGAAGHRQRCWTSTPPTARCLPRRRRRAASSAGRRGRRRGDAFSCARASGSRSTATSLRGTSDGQPGADHRREPCRSPRSRATRCSPARSTATARSSSRHTKPAADTTLARIIHMVEEAQARRAPAEQWVESFARIYTPAVMIAGAAGRASCRPLRSAATWGAWFYQALVLLVIACPCALVISTPVSIVAALAAAARHGVLIKGGALPRSSRRDFAPSRWTRPAR